MDSTESGLCCCINPINRDIDLGFTKYHAHKHTILGHKTETITAHVVLKIKRDISRLVYLRGTKRRRILIYFKTRLDCDSLD